LLREAGYIVILGKEIHLGPFKILYIQQKRYVEYHKEGEQVVLRILK